MCVCVCVCVFFTFIVGNARELLCSDSGELVFRFCFTEPNGHKSHGWNPHHILLSPSGTLHSPPFASHFVDRNVVRLRLKCDGTRAETRFRLSAKRTSPFKSAGASVQSTTGSRGVRISGSNAGYTMFRGSVKSTSYPLHSPVSPSIPPPVRHRVPSHFSWSLMLDTPCSEVV